MLKDVKMTNFKCPLLGDIRLNLFDTVQIKLQTPMRKNQTNYGKQPYTFKKGRKRINYRINLSSTQTATNLVKLHYLFF